MKNIVALLFFSFGWLSSSCIDGLPKLPIPEYMVVSRLDSAEVTLIDFVKMNALTALFYVDGDCSPCLAELTEWRHFFTEYPNLAPLLVVRTEHPDIFPLFMEINYFSFPTVYDYELSLWVKNHFAAVASLIVMNSEAGILYAGKPERDTSFTGRYQNWTVRTVNNNFIHYF